MKGLSNVFLGIKPCYQHHTQKNVSCKYFNELSFPPDTTIKENSFINDIVNKKKDL